MLAAMVESILRGESVVAVEELEEAFLTGTRNIDKRAIGQPER